MTRLGRVTRLGRLTCLLALGATLAVLAVLPMTADPVLVLSAWALALIGAVLMARAIDRADHAVRRWWRNQDVVRPATRWDTPPRNCGRWG